MIRIIQTRFMHWKKQGWTLLLWLLLPMVSTIIFISTTELFQEDTKIPVGIVIEEETDLAINLYEAISSSPLIRVLDVTESEARQMVKSHDLDSAFVIEEGYEEEIRKGNRNWLITSYTSDLSFGYTPVKERIISYVQDAAGKSKTAHTVNRLGEKTNLQWTWDEIVNKTEEIEVQENLLHTNFSFQKEIELKENSPIAIWDTWGLWALISLLCTFFLFDWVIKERRTSLNPRYAFMFLSMRNYLLIQLLVYIFILYVFDLIAVYVFHLLLNEAINFTLICSLLMYRILITISAFLLAHLFTKTVSYYSFSLTVCLFLTVLSGVIIPIDGITSRYPWIEQLHPLSSFIEQKGVSVWYVPILLALIIWWLKGGRFRNA
ncbi:ABC transporter permease [Oceanobacillus sp. Castelsardo]|uniref:ABC transporter permease n=1 Tax=Oceanobacillus sp. Castelsardo TaxID=1851204 RepID=UPI0008382D6F|nr:ABC transporter permease [Oceanobacillus sp. Castelsardo]